MNIKDRKSFGQCLMNRDMQNKMIKILDAIELDNNSYDFLEPVDYIQMELINYPLIITKPMDLGTIKNKVKECEYENVQQMLNDVQLVWDNCKTFNMLESDIYKMAIHCEKLFSKQIEKYFNVNLMSNTEIDDLDLPQKEVLSMCEKIELTEKLNTLNPEKIIEIVQSLETKCPKAIGDDDEEKLQIKIDYIPRSVYCSLLEIIDEA